MYNIFIRCKRLFGKLLLMLSILMAAVFTSLAGQLPLDSAIMVPLGGNGWVSSNAATKISEQGVSNWSGREDVISIYVRVESAGSLNIALNLRVPDGSSKICVAVGQTVLTKTVSNTKAAIISFGKVILKTPGYIQIKLTGLKRTGMVYAEVYDVVLSGTALTAGAAYVKDNHGNYFYWGRRGPSVHLNYKVPDGIPASIAYFYNEVTVPMGNDIVGSYFMADGFTGGYFGMQVNSATERHVLFSIWSPFDTDDPDNIPDSLRIKLLKKGDGVHTGAFGSEGSGGQSYLNFPWVAGKTYAFLIRAQGYPASGITVFTAWFKPADQVWQLIASFSRPKSGFYLKGLYSFLENFEPEMGTVTRKVYFGNQWVVDTAGNWYAINMATFTGDATAKINYRKDYSGGVVNGLFYLRNCGFFNDYTTLKTELERSPSNRTRPVIDFNKLP